MNNVTTDFLGNLIAVVDFWRFTRAAQLAGVTQPAGSAQVKRLPKLLGGVAIHVCAEPSSALLRDLRRGDYDLVVAASDIEIEIGAARTWLEPTAWGAASAAIAEGPGPIPLVVVGESSLSRRMSVETLERAGIDYEITYVGASFAGMVSAAAAGFGVACWAKRLLQRPDLQ